MIEDFFSLTPERVLQATEQAGERTTGLCYPLGSLENRVYEIELESGVRVVSKFYRPSRWSEQTILDEHRLLHALQQAEVPAVPPLPFADGSTLQRTQEGIYFARFAKVGGRSPDELNHAQNEQLGRLLARMHNVSASLGLKHRPTLNPATYGEQDLAVLLASKHLSPSAAPRLQDAVTRLVALAQPDFAAAESLVTHGDCHRGNLLLGANGFFLIDFDDAATAPAVQDFWLLLPARAKDCPEALDGMLEGYRQFRAFDMRQLRLIEALRGLRYVHYAAWICKRFADPAFVRTFNDFGTEVYWQRLTQDIYEQVGELQALQGYP